MIKVSIVHDTPSRGPGTVSHLLELSSDDLEMEYAYHQVGEHIAKSLNAAEVDATSILALGLIHDIDRHRRLSAYPELRALQKRLLRAATKYIAAVDEHHNLPAAPGSTAAATGTASTTK